LLCSTFRRTDDGDYTAAYRQAVLDVANGAITQETLEIAYRKAMDPTAKNPGRVFAHNLNLHGPPTAFPKAM
jgi:hypothetical protein